MPQNAATNRNLDPQVEQELARLLHKKQKSDKKAKLGDRAELPETPGQEGIAEPETEEGEGEEGTKPSSQRKGQSRPTKRGLPKPIQSAGEKATAQGQGDKADKESAAKDKDAGLAEQKPRVLKRLFDKATQQKKGRQLMKATELIGKGQGFTQKLQRAKRIATALKAGTAATLVGIIITFIVMNIQLILWGVKYLPIEGIGKSLDIKINLPLEIYEFFVLILVWLLIIAIIGFIIILIYLIYECSGISSITDCPIPGLIF